MKNFFFPGGTGTNKVTRSLTFYRNSFEWTNCRLDATEGMKYVRVYRICLASFYFLFRQIHLNQWEGSSVLDLQLRQLSF